LIDNAEQEAAKPRESGSESSGMTFEYAQIWESSNAALNDNEGDMDTDFWSKMIEQAQTEKEKKAAEEAAESGRGAQRRAKTAVVSGFNVCFQLGIIYFFSIQTYTMAWEESPDKKKAKRAKKKSDSDIEYQEPEGQPLASEDDDIPHESEDLVPEIGELQDVNHSLEDMQRRFQKEQRAQQKLARLGAQRLTSQSNTYQTQYNLPGSLLDSAIRPVPSALHSLNHSQPGIISKSSLQGASIQYNCPVCKKRHEPNNCSVMKGIVALKQLRARVQESSDNEEDKVSLLEVPIILLNNLFRELHFNTWTTTSGKGNEQVLRHFNR
jgi:hypothetical protein